MSPDIPGETFPYDAKTSHGGEVCKDRLPFLPHGPGGTFTVKVAGHGQTPQEAPVSLFMYVRCALGKKALETRKPLARERSRIIPFAIIDLMDPLRAGFGTFWIRMPRRSTGQFPRTGLHDCCS